MRVEDADTSQKRPNDDFAGDGEPAKRACTDQKDQLPAIDEDDDSSSLLIEEEMVNEVMKRLEQEIACPYFRPASLKLAHGNNEESCGPSFSDSSSSVMASIDMGGGSSNTSYFFGISDESELSGLSLVSPVTDSGTAVVGTVIDDCGFQKEYGPWLFEEDDALWDFDFELEPMIDGNGSDFSDGNGFAGAGDMDNEQEWFARALNGALFEFE